MIISLFQQDIQWLDLEANYLKVESVLRAHPESDLLVMPEMCTTGFVTTPSQGQLEEPSAVEQRLLRLSAQYHTALCGSFAVREGADNLNRAYFVTPEGEVWHSDKRHLFAPGGEGRSYKAGAEKCIVAWRGVRFLLQVCYDLRFPVWQRYTEEAPYDIIVNVANWPLQRRLAWDTLLSARAIENQAYVVGVNRVGSDLMCQYDGGTRVLHPYGHVVAECPNGVESVCSFEPDMVKLQEYRGKFPSLHDSDSFQLL